MTRVVAVLLVEIAALAAITAVLGLIPAEVWALLGKLAVWAGLTIALLILCALAMFAFDALEGRAERQDARRRNPDQARRLW